MPLLWPKVAGAAGAAVVASVGGVAEEDPVIVSVRQDYEIFSFFFLKKRIFFSWGRGME